MKKNLLNRLQFFKKLIGSVWFRFYKPETEKTKPNPNRKKPSQSRKNRAKPKKTKPDRKNQTEPEKNWAKPVFVLKNRTETGRFEPVCFFFISIWLLFFIKTEPNRKWSSLIQSVKKPSQTEKTESNRFEPVIILKNWTETGRFELLSVRF